MGMSGFDNFPPRRLGYGRAIYMTPGRVKVDDRRALLRYINPGRDFEGGLKWTDRSR